MRGSDDSAPLWPEHPRRRAFDVIGIGQNALDRICEVEALPRIGGKVALVDACELPGGQIATAVLGCARLGLRCAYAGSIGDDRAGAAVIEPLRSAGVDLAGVKTVPGAATQIGVILVERVTGERTVFWHRPAALRLRPEDLDRGRIQAARALLLDAGDPDAALWAAGIAREAGNAVILDADHFVPELAPLLEEVDFPIVSQEFADSYSDRRSPREALRMLSRLGARLAVVTLGARGVLAAAGEEVIESPRFSVEARDTTGAGDAFHAGFTWALLRGWGADAVLRTANAAAALSCSALGAQGGLPERAKLEAFLRSAGTD